MSSKNKRIYLSSPHMGGGEMKYINEAFDQNWVAPLGPNLDAFEESLCNYCGTKYAVALSSGTAAIHLALILAGVNPGDDVIASSFTFSATVNPIRYVGATPVLIDSEMDTWNMDPVLLEKAIVERRKLGNQISAIIPVHLYGMPAKMDEIMEVADRYSIPVVEDAAEALGSMYNGKPLGSFGKMGVVSFNGNKLITTSGGGAIVSNDKELVDKARFLSTQARDNAPHYQHSEIGYNYRLSNVLAGIGRGQMEVVDEWIRLRRQNFQFYYDHLNEIPGIQLINEPNDSYYSNRWLTTILIDPIESGTSKELIRDELEKENIEARFLWKPMHLQPIFQDGPAFINGISESLFSVGLCLPSGSNLSDTNRTRILDNFLRIINKR